ncbi:MAG: hypothetical protein ACRELB_21690 [Polyangiaceae bacterium]
MSERAFWLWTSGAIIGTALVESALPGACGPALVAQVWLGAVIALLAAFWPPPSGPGALPVAGART